MHTGAPLLQGFGYVHFASEEAAGKAAKAAGQGGLSLGGRGLMLDFETNSRPKGSFRRLDGRHWSESDAR